MQTVTPLYGLYVNCRDEQHDEYAKLKYDMEVFFRRMEIAIQLSNQRGVAPHLMALSNDKALSFCIANKQLFLAVYDKRTQQLSRRCEFNDLKRLSKEDFNYIEARINNILRLQDKDILRDKALNRAWGREIPIILKERAGQKTQKSQPLEFSFTGDFQKDCALAREVVRQERENRADDAMSKNVRDMSDRNWER